MDVEKKCPHCGKKLRRDNTRGACSACLANKEHRAGSPAPAVEKPPAAKPIQPRKQLELEGMPAAAAEPEYDLLITSGRVVDGTGNPWFYGDVAVTKDRIVAVGRAAAGKAKRTIDAKGLVVAPGFIDIHSHSDDLLLEDGRAQSKVRQGVTTEVLGEGNSAGPLKGQLRARSFKARGQEFTWDTLGGYFDAIDKAGRLFLRVKARGRLRPPLLHSASGPRLRPSAQPQAARNRPATSAMAWCIAWQTRR